MKYSRFSGLNTAVLILIKIILITFTPQLTESIAVISIDIGSEFMKIGIVKPGMPMEIVLNKESRRKTPLAVSLRGTERQFGELALAQCIKKPHTAYLYVTHLLAKPLDSPAVNEYKKKYPFHNIKEDPETKTVYFQHDEATTYTPEELLAMILDYARELAADYGEQSIDAAVITVPAYFNQAERKAVLKAAQLVDLKVLQLINSNTAAGLNYGVFRRKDFNTAGTTLMFFDMGASGTTATIATFQMVKNKGDYEANPQIVIRGVGYDSTLGGNVFALRLAKHFAEKFQEKTKKDVFQNAKSTIKIYKEAERVKNVLSANADHIAQIEGLMDDVDFKLKVTRKEFEEMCKDLFERVKNPVQDAVLLSELALDELTAVILVGGSTRIPKVQDELMKATNKKELGKNLNTDEAPALGAVYQAAYQSKGYKVKQFNVKDMNLFPIVVDFQKHSDETSNEKSYIRRILFDKTNQFPQKKVMTFNKHTDDFNFNVNYGDLSYLSEDLSRRIGSSNLSQVEVTGVKDVFAKHENDESKGIKVSFRINDDGILNLEKIDIAFETDSKEEISTITKLGNKISSFFSGSDGSEDGKDTPNAEKSEDNSEKQDPVKNLENQTNSSDANNLNLTETDSNSTLSKNMTLTVIKEDISYSLFNLDYIGQSNKTVLDSKKKLENIKEIEKEIKKKAAAINMLESFIFDTKDKLTEEEFIKCSTEAERETISTKLTEADDWLQEADNTVQTKEYKDKLQSLKKLCKDVYFRLNEKKQRPKKLEELKEVLNKSMDFLQNIRNLTGGEDQPLTQVQFDTLDKLINSTKEWKVKLLNEQAKIADNEEPKLLLADINDKAENLKREVSYLVGKIKYFRPPTKKTPLKSDEKTAKKSNTTEEFPTNKTNNTEQAETNTEESNDEKAENPETTTEKPKSNPDDATSNPEL